MEEHPSRAWAVTPAATPYRCTLTDPRYEHLTEADALSPSTGMEELVYLAGRFPEQVAANTGFMRQLAHHPDWAQGLIHRMTLWRGAIHLALLPLDGDPQGIAAFVRHSLPRAMHGALAEGRRAQKQGGSQEAIVDQGKGLLCGLKAALDFEQGPRQMILHRDEAFVFPYAQVPLPSLLRAYRAEARRVRHPRLSLFASALHEDAIRADLGTTTGGPFLHGVRQGYLAYLSCAIGLLLSGRVPSTTWVLP